MQHSKVVNSHAETHCPKFRIPEQSTCPVMAVSEVKQQSACLLLQWVRYTTSFATKDEENQLLTTSKYTSDIFDRIL